MRRTTILKSIATIIDALVSSNLASTMKSTMERISPGREKKEFDTQLLISLSNFATKYGQFTDAEIEIASIIGINKFADPGSWEELVQPESPVNIYNANTAIKFALEYLPRFLDIVTPSYAKFDFKQREPKPIAREGKGIVSVALYDNGGAPFTTDRFISLFTSMSVLYNVSSQILGEEKEPLILLGCDSGDVKVFDFEGAGKVIENVKDIIISVWDRIVFYRENKLSRRLDLITQSLPVLENIKKMKEDKTLAPEEAEVLKINVLSSVEGIIKSGAIIPEMDNVSNIHPYLLMTPEPKQLAQGEGTTNEHE